MSTIDETGTNESNTKGEERTPTGDVEEPASRKKSKPDPLRLISQNIFNRKDELKQEYALNKPYPHVVLSDLFEDSFLEKLILEIKDHSVVTFKESDLYKVYQSMDFANLNPNDPDVVKKLPHVMQLRELLYSTEWRRFIEEVADLPPGILSDQIDCACNCHITGCHLLCHDDVIGSRCISYILYLTEKDWKREEGGALELYGCVDPEAIQRVPDVVPLRTYLPILNNMAFFKVEPGTSFHAVQEVLGDRPRLSLQGWFHYDATSKKPSNQLATLDMLKGKDSTSREGDEGEEFLPNPVEENDDKSDLTVLSDADSEYLGTYINRTYLCTDELRKINDLFEEESSVRLHDFFCKDIVAELEKAMEVEDANMKTKFFEMENYSRGSNSNWSLVGPCHKQRYLEFQPDEQSGSSGNDQGVGGVLFRLKRDVFESPQFRRYLHVATSLGSPLAQRGRIRRFRPGLDYTVAHHGLLLPEGSPPILDATMCFVLDKCLDKPENETESEDITWESGNFGGFECYIEADEQEDNVASANDKNNANDPAEEYNEDDESPLLSVSACNNTLSLVLRDVGSMRFVKYVGARAPSSRWDIAMEYKVPHDDNDSDEA